MQQMSHGLFKIGYANQKISNKKGIYLRDQTRISSIIKNQTVILHGLQTSRHSLTCYACYFHQAFMTLNTRGRRMRSWSTVKMTSHWHTMTIQCWSSSTSASHSRYSGNTTFWTTWTSPKPWSSGKCVSSWFSPQTWHITSVISRISRIYWTWTQKTQALSTKQIFWPRVIK